MRHCLILRFLILAAVIAGFAPAAWAAEAPPPPQDYAPGQVRVQVREGIAGLQAREIPGSEWPLTLMQE